MKKIKILKQNIHIKVINFKKKFIRKNKKYFKKEKQKILIKLYKTEQIINYYFNIILQRVEKFLNSTFFYVICSIVILYLVHIFTPDLLKEDIKSMSLTIAGIIGGSIAIIFSFSLFILQNTAEFFSTQYLNRFINNTKEKITFWSLVLLSILSLITPFIFQKYLLEILILILIIAFYLIFTLFREIRVRINPETTLKKILENSIHELDKINKKFIKQSNKTSKIYEYNENSKKMNLDVIYKINPSWHLYVKENIKHLFEISFRLLSKNEINSFNLSVKYIRDIYVKHLELRSGFFIKKPYDLFGTYTFDDEGFTTYILEYLQSISERLIQEKRKENIYYLLKIYENLIVNALEVKYADNTYYSKGDPLTGLILGYYIIFIEKIIDSKENDWIWESIVSISRISNNLIQKTDDHFLHQQIYKILNKIISWCIKENKESHLREIVKIYFYKINLSWDKDRSDIYWNDLFKELKKGILTLSIVEKQFSMSISNLFIDFNAWKSNITNVIFKLKDKKERKKQLDNLLELLKKWSDFLLDFTRDIGLENKIIGLSIVQSVENNIDVIRVIKYHNKELNLQELYNTQFYTLGWYFTNIKEVDNSTLFNLENVFEILLKEIIYNLNNKTFDVEHLIELYIRLVEQHFEKITTGHGYNHPRVIEKLLYLGLILYKFKMDSEYKEILFKINDLNNKYLNLNKEFFDLKEKNGYSTGAEKHQLCKEIYDLKNSLFSGNSNYLQNMNYLLRQEIEEDDWNNFIKEIKYCEGVEYKTESMHPF